MKKKLNKTGTEKEAVLVMIRIDPPIPMSYHEYSDYPYCVCGNFEKADGFNRCDRGGNLIQVSVHSEFNEYGRCERCGRIIDVKRRQIIGRLKNFQKRCI